MNAVSSNPSAASLEIEVRPSRLIATLLLAIHVTAAVVCAQLPAPMLDRLVLLLAVLGALMWNVVSFWHRTPRRLYWSQEQGWRITDFRRSTRSAKLLPGSYIGNWLLVVHFRRHDGKLQAVMLARDSCSAWCWRRLRLLLAYLRLSR